MLTFDKENQKNIWVENPYGGNAFLEFQVRTTEDQTVVLKDRVYFYSFTSAVIAFGGREGYPTDPPNNLDGVFIIAKDLYLQGYDVYMFAHTQQSNARAEVDSAIDDRSVNEMGIFGYSFGGDETYELQKYLKNKEGFGTSFHTKFTAYIDAINKPGNFALTERPLSADYLLNYYEKNTLLCHGARVEDALVGDNQYDITDTGANHYNIDNQTSVYNGIKTELRTRVNP